jgi:hypothetical protein
VGKFRIDVHLDGEGFDAIDSGGQNAGQHGWMLGERGRKDNAVFAAWQDNLPLRLSLLPL